MASSVDPDETARYEPSHLDLHCLQRYLFVGMKGYPVHQDCSISWVSSLGRAPVAWWIRELTLNPLGLSPLWFEPRLGHMWESQVLLTDGQVVFPRVIRFSPTFDERSARHKLNVLERAVKPK